MDATAAAQAALRAEYASGVVVMSDAVSGTSGRLKHGRFHCLACSKNLTMETRVRCMECTTETDFCLSCFCAGKEPGSHSKHHKYQVLSNLHFPLFGAKWSAEEEMLLLEALTLYGFGNWPDVADHVGTKTEDECFDHYQSVYAYVADQFPAPLGLQTPLAPASVPPTLQRPIRVADFVGKHKKQQKKAQQSNPIKPDLGGYMPLRGEFELPYNDQAEVPVATIKFDESDTADERQLKMDALQVYLNMLDERAERSAFVANMKLLKWKSQQKLHRALTDEADRKMLHKLRALLQVTTKEKWEQFVDGMVRESSLRRAIEYYSELRKEGIRTERDAEDYQLRARKRGKYMTRRDAPIGPPPVYENLAAVLQTQSRTTSSARSGAGGSGYVAPSFQDPVSAAPGAEVLGVAERKLAGELELLPDQFCLIKEAMVRESCRVGRLSRKDARMLAPFVAEKMDAIWDLLTANAMLMNSK